MSARGPSIRSTCGPTCSCRSMSTSSSVPTHTDSEKSLRGMASVILRRSRRIWPSNETFLPLTAQILRCAQDDKRGARINPNPYQRFIPSRILQAIKQPVSRRVLIYLRKCKPQGLRLLATGQSQMPYCFWQAGGGYDRNMTSVETIKKAIRYIHENPVRRGLVLHPIEWPYSSARDWETGISGQLPIDFDTFPTL